TERQYQEGKEDHAQVHEHLAPNAQPAAEQMCVAVAGQEGGLEEDHAGVPDRRCAAEQRQNHLGDHGLHQKEQQGTGEKCCGEEEEERQGCISAQKLRRPWRRVFVKSIILNALARIGDVKTQVRTKGERGRECPCFASEDKQEVCATACLSGLG